jgi:prepilin-type N-terminal cleavage/methylation domain-containing protein
LRGGFSLLEVLLALTVLGIALAAFSFIFGAAARSASRTRMQTDLHLLAQMRMSQIEAGEIDPEQFQGGDFTFDRKPDYAWHCEIDDGWEPAGRVRQITVVVRYEGPDGTGEAALTRLLCLRDEPRADADGQVAAWLPGVPVQNVAIPQTPAGGVPNTGGFGGGPPMGGGP